jgi:hypothetical protein
MALVATAAGVGGNVASASSHREAPLIAGEPQHDNTDVYAFVSPNNHKTVTLIANWIPFEDPNGGPNFYPWATHTHYDINIDSNGDGRPDLTYRWQFHTFTKARDAHGGTFLYDNGPVTKLGDKNLLFKQRYSLTAIRGHHRKVLVKSAPVTPSDTGAASMPHYGKLRRQAITHTKGGGKTVAAQSADPFFLDLRVFDLLYGGNLGEAGQDTLAGYNVNYVALQVPKKKLALHGKAKKNPVIGVWSSTEAQSLKLTPGKEKSHGKFVQVSRLGNPLVNEVVVPSKLKDAFNSIPPYQDHTIKPVVNRVLHPEVPKLIQSIYGIKAPKGPRNDLAEIFLSGICKNKKVCFHSPVHANLNSQSLNKGGRNGKHFVPAEELRLNMGVPVTKHPNRLGVLGGDLQGFPNGRRLTDDVVDIELLALEGAARGKKVPAALKAGDGVNAMPAFSQVSHKFPYTPLPNHNGVNTH